MSRLYVATVLMLATFTSIATTAQPSKQVRPNYVVHDAAVLALRNVRVIDGTGAPAKTDQTIVLTDGRISAVGPAADVEIPAGATVLDLKGRTVVPGLIMLHEHLMYFSGRALRRFGPLERNTRASSKPDGNQWKSSRS